MVELYAKTMQVLYREDYSADQELKMISVLSGLMDEDLLANQTNLPQSIKKEIQDRKKDDYSISNYVIVTKEPEITTVDGRKMCHIDCWYSLRKGTAGTTVLKYRYVMRQDSEDRWKVFGWDLVPAEDQDK